MIESRILEKYQIKPYGLERGGSKSIGSLANLEKSEQTFLPFIKSRSSTLGTFPREYGANKIHSNLFRTMGGFFPSEDRSNAFYKKRILPFSKKDTKELPEEFLNYSKGRDLRTSLTSIMIHNDPMAERLAKSYGAEALTLGREIFISPSKADLSTSRGKALLVHEITHVIQQEKSPELRKGDDDANAISLAKYSELEREAENAERNFLRLSSLWEHSEGRQRPPDDLHLVQTSISQAMRNMVKANFSELVEALSLQSANLNMQQRGEGQVSSSSVKVSTARPFLAQEGRAVNPPVITSLLEPLPSGELISSPPSISASQQPSIDITGLADQVYDMIARRLKMERDRRGIR
jgi:hypothetical protein